MQVSRILVTGSAGFIGYSLINYLCSKNQDIDIIGIDNLNDYYDVDLKYARLDSLKKYQNFKFIKLDLCDKDRLFELFKTYNFDVVINLAAQAGVRYSITNPKAYIESNIIGFYNVLECVRYSNVKHLIFASSSSVYGENSKVPYSEEDKTARPVSLYAASKLSNEVLAYSYAKLYNIPITGLRFFTVYGPFGRPDMAYFSFTNKLVNNEQITLFNHGDMYRDFTYVEDVCIAIEKMIYNPVKVNDTGVNYQIYNIGNNHPVALKEFYNTLLECLISNGIIKDKVEPSYKEMQPGDVYQTYADVDKLKKDFNVSPKTSLKDGLDIFVKWYKDYYKK